MLNNMRVDPDEWFDAKPHPHDSMPVATDRTITDEYAPCDVEHEIPAELMEVPTSVKNPEPEPKKKKEETIHQKMYEIATSKYNPFSVGGSENIHDFDSVGGSEEAHK